MAESWPYQIRHAEQTADRGDVYDTRELAAHIGVPESTVIAWRRLNAGPPPVKIAGRTMYLDADVEQWVDGDAPLGYGVELGPRFVA